MAVVGGVVFFAVRASARPDPWLDGPDQEMGGRGRAVRRDLLSPAVGAQRLRPSARFWRRRRSWSRSWSAVAPS